MIVRTRRVTHCPHCLQPLPELRGGAKLPPTKARLFDAVKAAGPGGIISRELMFTVYEGRKLPKRLDTIRNHINQINDLMTDDWRIVCRDRRHWRLERLERAELSEWASGGLRP